MIKLQKVLYSERSIPTYINTWYYGGALFHKLRTYYSGSEGTSKYIFLTGVPHLIIGGPPIISHYINNWGPHLLSPPLFTPGGGGGGGGGT